jgi:hypothetical protein
MLFAAVQRFNESQFLLHRFARWPVQIFSHSIENPVHETARFRAAKTLG